MSRLINIDKEPSATKVVVAMSGGVDSSTVAAMLHNAGYDVIGVTLQLYDYGITVGKTGACCAGQDIYDAKMVAEKFGFPHYILDYESVFKEAVMDDFADSYLRGETPIPCVRCNQSVKFRDLYKVAKDLGADALATGHYVQRVDVAGQAQMHQALDKGKDQSYFLFSTTQEQLDFLHFPLGGLTKERTREIAREIGIAIHDKPDSQDICFVPDGDYAAIVRKLRPDAEKKGEIFHVDGFKMGEHNGIINFTIGQRKGLGIGGLDEPLYVVRLEPETARVFVGPDSALEKIEFLIKEINWLDSKPNASVDVQIKVRSSMQPVPARVEINGDSGKITLPAAYRAITPGQACVMYDGERMIGGGWITRS